MEAVPPTPTHQEDMRPRTYIASLSVLWVAVSLSVRTDAKDSPTAPFRYVWSKAYHIPPETTTNESGYFSLCEGHNGKIYVGTAAYGRNAYLVEFDPTTEKMRIVLNVQQIIGKPLTNAGYAAQAKIHTRNFVGPSGKIYLGSKQGSKSDEEKRAQKRGEKIPVYQGGYVMVYDPTTNTTENLGMPMPLDDQMLAAGKVEGQGVIDVTADESRGLIYVITCEEQHWMLYDRKTKTYRKLGPILNGQPNTLVDSFGRATAMTNDDRIARYDPRNDQVTVDTLLLDNRPIRQVIGSGPDSPDWRLTKDGRTAYLQYRDDRRIFRIDLSRNAGQPVIATNLGNRIEGQNPDSRCSISINRNGQVFTVTRVDNQTGFGEHSLHHLARHDPASGAMDDLGVLAIQNPGFYFQTPGAPVGNLISGSAENPSYYGYHQLPDGTLTPKQHCLAMIVAQNGTIYVTVLYPFTLLKIEPAAYHLEITKKRRGR